MMRLCAAIAAVTLAAATLPAAARADGSSPAAVKAHPVRHARVVAHHHWRHRRPLRPWPVAELPQLPVYFAREIPATLNPGYDRAMVLLMRSPAVSGVYTDEPGYPVTPVVAGIAPYQRDLCCAVFQYDTTIGAYVQLSQADSVRSAPPPGDVPIPAPPQ